MGCKLFNELIERQCRLAKRSLACPNLGCPSDRQPQSVKIVQQGLNLSKISVHKAYYIKLGTKGEWEKLSLSEEVMRFGWPSTPIDRILAKDWLTIEAQLRRDVPRRGIATRDINALRMLCESVTSDVWITFYSSRLWWCRLAGTPMKEDKTSKFLEASRRGGHLWLFLEPIPAWAARQLLDSLLRQAKVSGMELFPKQDQIDPDRGVGSLVRGPLGVHRVAGRRFGFLRPDTLKEISPRLEEEVEYLSKFQKVSRNQIFGLLSAMTEGDKPRVQSSVMPGQVYPEQGATGNGLIAEIKNRLPLHEFVGRFVPLDKYGRGRCPFHPPDQHPSFAVNIEGGYWVDFHQVNPHTGRYIGGDVICFWERYRGISRRQAVGELARMAGITPGRKA